MANPKDFANRMRARADQIAVESNRVARRAALTVLQTVVVATPVDTGRARSNWNTELNRPNLSTREPYAPGDSGSTGAANARRSIEEGTRVITDRATGQDIWITNNLPYIGELNNGHSAQAPAGFIERAVQAGRATVRRSRLMR